MQAVDSATSVFGTGAVPDEHDGACLECCEHCGGLLEHTATCQPLASGRGGPLHGRNDVVWPARTFPDARAGA